MKKVALGVVFFLVILNASTLSAKNTSFGLLLQKNAQDYFQVKGVVKNSPAYDLGLKPGDIIEEVNNSMFSNPLIFRKLAPGDKIVLSVIRDGKKIILSGVIKEYNSNGESLVVQNNKKNADTKSFDMKSYSMAISSALQKLEEAKGKNDFYGQVSSLQLLSQLYTFIGLYDKAEKSILEAIKLSKEPQSKVMPAQIRFLYSPLIKLYLNTGQYEKAIKFYYEEYNKIKGPDLSTTNEDMADIFRFSKQYHKALTLYSKLYNPRSQDLYKVRILGKVMDTYYRMGEYEKAEKNFGLVSDIVNKNNIYNEYVIEFLLRQGEFEKALNIIESADKYTKPVNINEKVARSFQKALAFKFLGKLELAGSEIENTISLIENIRDMTKLREYFFRGGRVNVYKEAVSIFSERYLSSGKTDNESLNKAFYYAELSKGRTLLDKLVANMDVDKRSVLPNDLKEKEKEFVFQLRYLDSTYEEMVKKDGYEEYLNKRDSLRREFEAFVEELNKQYPMYVSLYYPRPLMAKDIKLKDNECLVEYVLTENNIYVFVIRSNLSEIVALPVKKVVIEEKVTDLLEYIRRNKKDKFLNLSHELYQLLLKPLNIEQSKSLIIIPDGILGVVPFDALVKDKSEDFNTSVYAGDNLSISYLQSATVMAILGNKNTTDQKELLFAVANPVFSKPDYQYSKTENAEDTNQNAPQFAFRGLKISKETSVEKVDWEEITFPPLPETETEVKEIAKILNVTPKTPQILLGLDASEENVKKAELEKYKYIHFATHASLPGFIAGIQEPFILLSQVENHSEDGFLTLSEVSNLKLNADMVVLSACVTGLGKEIDGEGIANFARAFEQAGAKSVVVSLWEVPSEPAVEFMKVFYTYLNLGFNRLESIRYTKRDIKLKYPNPYYWAVFVLYGYNI
ncbi:MAG: tetratricopeptide repeat protein [Deferribacteraceae bacterium]|nr:tetratricopeptide repeat protein [Deferribacteraceae bacterium]